MYNKVKLYKLKKYYLYFMMYAVIGWCYEVFLEVFIYNWGFTNRGFLFGPYCPIYGFGALIFIFSLSKIMNRKKPNYFKFIKPIIIFFGCMIIATFIELLTSYIMEFFTGSWPWQTYSDYKINFQARIALSPSLRFGIGGVIFLYFLQPFFRTLLQKLKPEIMNIVFYMIIILFTVDFLIKILSIIFVN